MESLIANNDKLKISFTIIYGDKNEIIGNNNIIYGDKNEIIGNNNIAYGEGNIIDNVSNRIDSFLDSPTSQGRIRRTSSRKKVSDNKNDICETKIPIYEEGLPAANNDMCIVCLENTKSTVCIPCGHVIYCIPCIHDISHAMKSITCSICRQPVSEVMKVFLS